MTAPISRAEGEARTEPIKPVRKSTEKVELEVGTVGTSEHDPASGIVLAFPSMNLAVIAGFKADEG